jgi:hypothetical protein
MHARQNEVFSGHESFVCRYGWLPKLYETIANNPTAITNDEDAIVHLGIGRNMVKSIRFWGQAFDLIETESSAIGLTDFAKSLLDPDQGTDPFLENLSSLWKLHWKLSTAANLAAWNVAFSQIRAPEISRSKFQNLVLARAKNRGSSIAASTITQHVEIFLRTYDCSRLDVDTVPEESLGAPFQELRIFETVKLDGNETIRFFAHPKPGLDVHAFCFALSDYWRRAFPQSQTISFREITLAQNSPGAVFRLDETTAFTLLDQLTKKLRGFALQEDGVGGFALHCKSKTPCQELRECANNG